MSWYKDNAGRIPSLGDYVAYNWSGSIATGYIVRIGGSKLRPIYEIQRILPEPRPNDNHSIVRGGARCLLVLQNDS